MQPLFMRKDLPRWTLFKLAQETYLIVFREVGNMRINQGSHGWWLSATLDGRIGSVLMYNSALSPSEVEHNFDAMKGRFLINL